MLSDSLKLLIEARNPIIAMETADEPRAVRAVRSIAKKMQLPLVEWSVTQGLSPAPPEPVRTLVEPGKVPPALRYVKESQYQTLYLFKDLGAHCKDPQIARHLRELYFSAGNRLWTLILVDGTPLPPDVRRLTIPFDVGWPDEEEMTAIVCDALRDIQQRSLTRVEIKLTKRELEQLVRTLRGLTADEATRIVYGAVREDGVLDGSDLPRIVDAKRNRLGAMGCLETIVADVSPEDIGGLSNLKRWLNRRRGGFTRQAREFGLEPPRGMLLLGVQGCGKSLCAKVVASAWNMPLLRMDPGVLYQKFVGESEARLREALDQAESMAPVVMWIDEIEKAFTSASSESADGGLSQRMFGTLLSWMQDHHHPIFLVATANNIAQLPPELMRKGRFDEVFFVDLPGVEEREKIFGIHLRKRRRVKEQFNVAQLAAAADGFSGAEIEQAIVSALYAAFSTGVECTTEHIATAVQETRPISVLMRERIESLREWAHGRCVPAD